jgi:hypothetical protein
MNCAVDPCQAEAVGIWRWSTPYCGAIRMTVPMCDEHRHQKARSRAPGTFELYETAS